MQTEAGKRPDPCNAIEFIDDEHQRWAWSESNVQYERAGEDSGSYWLIRDRLATLQRENEELRAALAATDREVSVVHDLVHKTGTSLSELDAAIWKVHDIARAALEKP